MNRFPNDAPKFSSGKQRFFFFVKYEFMEHEQDFSNKICLGGIIIFSKQISFKVCMKKMLKQYKELNFFGCFVRYNMCSIHYPSSPLIKTCVNSVLKENCSIFDSQGINILTR